MRRVLPANRTNLRVVMPCQRLLRRTSDWVADWVMLRDFPAECARTGAHPRLTITTGQSPPVEVSHFIGGYREVM